MRRASAIAALLLTAACGGRDEWLNVPLPDRPVVRPPAPIAADAPRVRITQRSVGTSAPSVDTSRKSEMSVGPSAGNGIPSCTGDIQRAMPARSTTRTCTPKSGSWPETCSTAALEASTARAAATIP